MSVEPQAQEVEAFGLTSTQLNILIATYYEDVGWIPEDHNERRGLTPEIKKLVKDDLVYIANMVREVSAVHSIGDGGFAKFVSRPASMNLAIAITDEGKQLVELVNLSRRADACIAEGDIYTIRSFINTLDIKVLPEFLSHGHSQIREEAAERLADCIKSIPTEDLPELLTDSDAVVRDTADSILTHSIFAGQRREGGQAELSDRKVRFDAVDIGIGGGEAEE